MPFYMLHSKWNQGIDPFKKKIESRDKDPLIIVDLIDSMDESLTVDGIWCDLGVEEDQPMGFGVILGWKKTFRFLRLDKIFLSVRADRPRSSRGAKWEQSIGGFRC